LVNNTQVKHRSNNQQSSKNKKNHQSQKNKKKSYIQTNPQPQAKEENRLKRVDENKGDHVKPVNHNKNKNKLSNQSNDEKGKSSFNPGNNEKGNSPSRKEKGKSASIQAGNGNSASSQSKTGNTNSASGQSKNGNANPASGQSKNGNANPASTQSKNGNGNTSSTQSRNGNGNSSSAQSKNENGNSNSKPSSTQSKTGNGKKRTNDGGKNSETGVNTSEDQEVKHKEQSGKFETAFNRIHKALKDMVKTDSDAFVELLYSGYKNHSLVRKYKSELHQFAKLRNAIVHERVNADYYIAEPHIEVVERIEEIAREFEKPQTALSIATSPVFYYYEDAYLKDVLKVINKFDFTRFPVYDKDDKYVALLTSTEIIQWMAKHFSDNVVHFEDVRVKELLTKGKNYFVTFVDEDASLYHIEELFERYHTRGKKLQAVIITETGDRHGKPIGVITPWDLLDSDPED
jgi:CBS domain-containing protein